MNTILIMLIAIILMFFIERLWPANALPKTDNWWPRVILVNTTQALIVWILGNSWDRWIAEIATPWAIKNSLPLGAQILLGYLVITFIYYWWHRLRHESKFFWRLCHQLHHSPRRMEVFMSFYKHPVEISINAILSSLIIFLILGCSVQASLWITLATGLAELFYHWNIKTPIWLGPFFQRPESHRVHHQRHHHTNNYSDIPLWDMLFGTYKNPKATIPRCGFEESKEARFDDMLALRDVNDPAYSQLSPLHLLPSCIGCSKRWACDLANKHNTTHENKDL